MSDIKLDDVLLAYAVEDVPDGRFQGLEGGVSLGPAPFVFDFAPQCFDFIEVGAVSGQIEEGHVLGLPSSEPRLEGGGVVDAGVIEHEHRGPGAGGSPGIEGVDDKGGVQASLAGGGVQLVGGRVVEAQHVEALTVAGPGSDVFVGKLPAVGDG